MGEEDSFGDSIDDHACLLIALETPTSVIEHMDSTRALDGMQTNNWDEFEARWNEHPNSGTGLTITLAYQSSSEATRRLEKSWPP